MNSAADDIKELLEAEPSLGLVFATNLFVGKELSTPDNCVTLFDTPSGGPLVTLDGMKSYFYPSIQVLVRNRSYPLGYDMAQKIMLALHGRGNEEIGGTMYLSIICSGDVGFLDWDENGRVHFVVNFNVQRRI